MMSCSLQLFTYLGTIMKVKNFMKVNGAHISNYFLNLKRLICSSKFKDALQV
jgi:hypothetical protein